MTEQIQETVDQSVEMIAPPMDIVETPQQDAAPMAPAEIPEHPQQGQWSELRQALKELKRENQQLRADLTRPAPVADVPDPDESEPYVTPQSLKKKMAALEAKLHAKETEATADRLRAKFADFDEVVSVDNVEYLKTHDPELAQSIRALAADPYSQGVAAYKILKRTEINTNRTSMADKQKIAANTAKPQSVQNVRKQGALSDANKFAGGLTPDLKKALWAEMTSASKGA